MSSWESEAEMAEQEKKLNDMSEATDGITMPQEEETYLEMSPIRLIMRRFFRSKLSMGRGDRRQNTGIQPYLPDILLYRCKR